MICGFARLYKSFSYSRFIQHDFKNVISFLVNLASVLPTSLKISYVESLFPRDCIAALT